MNNKKILALICATSMLLAGCNQTENPTASPDTSNSAVTSTENPASDSSASGTEEGSETSTTSSGTNGSETTAFESSGSEGTASETTGSESTGNPEKISLSIAGYDNDNIPRLDGSLANEPLLIRMMSELTGVDADTAEVYLADSFISGGTSTSWGRLLSEDMDLIISYEPPQEIKDRYVDDFDSLEIDPLGRDGLVFIVNVNNPIESLTVDQIRDIYTGRITDWSEVGGTPGKIKAFQRNSTSGSQTLLNKLVMNGEETMKPDTDLLIGEMAFLIESVASFDGDGSAIGFSVYYYADRMKADPNLKMLKVEGVAPSNESIEDDSYPLVNDFYMAIRASEPSDAPARLLRDWLLSDKGKTLLEEEGYVWARNGLGAESRGAGNPFRP